MHSVESIMSAFYTGNYLHLLDSKGRISFPAEWRRIVPGQQEYYLITLLWPERCLGIYPAGEWERIRDSLKEDRVQEDSVLLRERHRRILQHTYMAGIDQNGRFPVKSELSEMAGLKGKVLLLGNLDHVEIWAQERRKEYEDSLEISNDDLFLDLSARDLRSGSEKTMGKEVLT